MDGGWIKVDDADLEEDLVRILFRLEGEIVGAGGSPESGAVRIWGEGGVALVLREGVQPALPAGMRAWFEHLSASR